MPFRKVSEPGEYLLAYRLKGHTLPFGIEQGRANQAWFNIAVYRSMPGSAVRRS
jgi:hypothetical protein